ncbi:hypothetical protein BH10PLA2_BH10PLA2_20120 [soil metagenome]
MLSEVLLQASLQRAIILQELSQLATAAAVVGG